MAIRFKSEIVAQPKSGVNASNNDVKILEIPGIANILLDFQKCNIEEGMTMITNMRKIRFTKKADNIDMKSKATA